MRTLLVANRGEIARRVFRTARAIGIRTVAVHADVDGGAPFVGEADVAVRLGDGAPRAYLDIDALLDAAVSTGADAVHPGYGFLAEQGAFARAVIGAGLTWVGPPPEAMDTMGDKIAAKRSASAAGVPLLPDAPLTGDDPARWHESVAPVGYPLLVKAAAGGGGRGMRLVADDRELADAVIGARREADSAFGDSTVYAERYVAAGRHVEIQLVADRHGAVMHLGERECSIQRRHQKIVEESPSPVVDRALRDLMGTAAVRLAAGIGYEGVGTVEFLLEDSGRFWFLEMNTRLQVEHPVTEAVTGLDLVRLQLEVAGGSPLGLTQDDLRIEGHAIEVRLCAEDPSRDFLPGSGTLHRWAPASGSTVRWDSGVETGNEISPHYDSLLAKAIAHAPNRTEAAATLARDLRSLTVHGVTTNRALLVGVLEDPDFLAGDTTTAFLEQHPALSTPPIDDGLLAAHSMAATLHAQAARRRRDVHWALAPTGWGRGAQRAEYLVGPMPGPDATTAIVAYRTRPDARFEITVSVERGPLPADPVLHDPGVTVVVVEDESITLELGGRRTRFAVRTKIDGDGTATTWVDSFDGHTVLVEVPRFTSRSAEAAAGGPLAPVPGTVLAVEVAPGDAVAPGKVLVVLEAMKVEHRIAAHDHGVVGEVLVAVGDSVDAHQLLVRLTDTAG